MILYIPMLDLVSCGGALFFLLKPVFLGRCRTALTSHSTLNIDCLRLVCLQLARNIGLLGRRRGFGDRELVHMAFSVGRLDFWDLVAFEFAEVYVLHKIGYSTNCISLVNWHCSEMDYLIEWLSE